MHLSAHRSVRLHTMFVVCSDNNACESTAAAGWGNGTCDLGLLLLFSGALRQSAVLPYANIHIVALKTNQTGRLDSHCYRK